MKAALMNQNTLPIIGSGPIASAPAASAGNKDMFYMSTDFGLCKYVACANDYVGAYISLNTPTCLINPSWRVEFTTKSLLTSEVRIYGEGRSDEPSGATILGIGSDLTAFTKLRVLLRDSTNSVKVDIITAKLTPFDGAFHEVVVEKNLGIITVTVDGITETFTGLYAGTIAANPNTSTIGALRRTTVTSDFAGTVLNFKKCDQNVIPLMQSSGTAVFDSAGANVGTLTDPNGTFWGYACVPMSRL